MAHFPGLLPLSLLELLTHSFTHLIMIYLMPSMCLVWTPGWQPGRCTPCTLPPGHGQGGEQKTALIRQQKAKGQPSEESAPKPRAEPGKPEKKGWQEGGIHPLLPQGKLSSRLQEVICFICIQPLLLGKHCDGKESLQEVYRCH